MKISLVTAFYGKIMCSENEGVLAGLNVEIQEMILGGELKEEKDMMILNLALQVKSNFFLMKELMMYGGGTTTIIMGGVEDFDPEEMQLEEFQQEEIDDFKDGNVVLMADFKKK